MKTIKNSISRITALAGLILVSTSTLLAQKSGVFKSYADFQTGTMEYEINCTTEKHKIRLNDFLGKDFLTVVHDGRPYDIKKAETWGYQLCDEKLVRFQGTDHFPLEDKGILWIYTKQTVQTVSRGGSKTVKTYYFSKGGNGTIALLTLLNLKSAFQDDHKLHDVIDSQFKSDASLKEFDQYYKKFRINHFLESQEVK